MEEKKKALVRWIKKHKKELIIAGVGVSGIALIVAVVFGAKNSHLLEQILTSLKQLIGDNQKMPVEIVTPAKDDVLNNDIVSETAKSGVKVIHRAPHDVSEFIRNLPKGYNASAEKLAMAAEKGIELLPGQTIVKSYRTGGECA